MTMKKVWNQLVEELGKQMIRRTPKGLLKTLSDLDNVVGLLGSYCLVW